MGTQEIRRRSEARQGLFKVFCRTDGGKVLLEQLFHTGDGLDLHRQGTPGAHMFVKGLLQGSPLLLLT